MTAANKISSIGNSAVLFRTATMGLTPTIDHEPEFPWQISFYILKGILFCYFINSLPTTELLRISIHD